MSYEQQREDIFQQLKDFSGEGFEALALQVFRFQAMHNPLYGQFLALLDVDYQRVATVAQIPFLPVRFFKSRLIKTGDWTEQAVFSSSGTTGAATSRHPVRDLDFYRQNTVSGFRQFYGNPCEYCVLALLPSYLERSGSSLVCMAEHFIRLSKHLKSGFFLHDRKALTQLLRQLLLKEPSQKILLIGVSFALLDLAEEFPMNLSPIIVMETGGMKGRRRELTRNELHDQLKSAFQLGNIHSEYGMTELLSQAYSPGNGIFHPTATMRALTREITDPLARVPFGKTGVLDMVDLANFDTCSFIATDDLGKVYPDHSFEVLGRMDNSDVRGCNLLVEL